MSGVRFMMQAKSTSNKSSCIVYFMFRLVSSGKYRVNTLKQAATASFPILLIHIPTSSFAFVLMNDGGFCLGFELGKHGPWQFEVFPFQCPTVYSLSQNSTCLKITTVIRILVNLKITSNLIYSCYMPVSGLMLRKNMLQKFP
jgi:hypothetical protein